MPEKVDVPEEKLPPPTEVTIPDRVTSETRGGGEASTTTTVKVVTAEKPAPTHFRRYQTLHVYQFRHRKPKKLLSRKLEQFLLLVPCRIIAFAVLIGIAAVLVLCGAYGTAAIVTCSATSRFATQSIAVQRPPGYLENNEHGGDGACMLVATHQNATEWHLFTGERAIVDTLLNKTMFTIPHQQAAGPVAVWLRLANVLQLLAMTFTAAQKDWDGVCLVALLVLSVISRWRLREGSLAGRWLADAGVEVKLTRFRFSGRLAMVGAVEIFGGTGVTTWMDDIVAPHPRRDAWLRRMQGGDIADDGWTRHDLAMIERNARLSVDAAKMMERELSKANAKYDKS
ncbi:Peptidase family m3 [Lasiodiplodia theobromae]|uniref:Peptidase family m3 n=1 Tax=Lasiodiplodia theobromae TaxID=45133 RepID=UPI0015C3B3E1|nr:Peptidase family m3 [Lasiodiplodia theobromae]KAF4544529.1 Peptidase family m3 [Lasiodiplodia theobromae]